MLRRILLPLSPGDDESRAVDFTRALAHRGAIEVFLLRVEEWPLFGTGSGYAWSPAARAGRLTTVRKAFGPSRAKGVRALAGESAASGAILEKARRGGISLIVIPYRSESLWNRVFRAPGAQRVLRESPIPVLAVPEESVRAPVSIRRILFVHPGGEAAAQASRVAIEIAQFFEGKVDLLRVAETPASRSGTWSSWLRREPEPGTERAPASNSPGDEELASLFQRRGVPARLAQGLREGQDPVACFARSNPVDLAVLADPWPPARPGVSRIRFLLEDLRVPLLVSRETPRTEPRESPPSFQLRV